MRRLSASTVIALLPSVVALWLLSQGAWATLDYHASLVLAPVVGLSCGHLQLLPRRRWHAAVAALGPLALLILGSVWIANCDRLYGLAFYALGPLMSALVGSAMGSVVARIPCRPRAQFFALWLLALGSAARPAWHFLHEPQVFAYHGLFGYIAGALYEDAVAIRWPYIAWRLTDLAFWGILLVFPSGSWPVVARHPRTPWLLMLALTAWCVTELRAPYEPWRVTANDLQSHVLTDTIDVPARLGAPALRLHLPSGPRWAKERQWLAEDTAFRAWELSRWFGAQAQSTIDIYLYANATQKRQWMGAERVDMAKPWLHQVHLVLPEFGASVLKHELAHVFAGFWSHNALAVPLQAGLVPNALLIEGMAMAAEWPVRGGLNLHQWARAMRRLGLAPEVAELLTPTGFFSHSGERSYTIAGSLVRWLADTQPLKVAELYTTGDWQAATGSTAAALAAQWAQYVDDDKRFPLTDADLARARARFASPSLFARPCALALGRCDAAAERLHRGGHDWQAADLWEETLAELPKPLEPSLTLNYVERLIQTRQWQKATAHLNGLAELPDATTQEAVGLQLLQRAGVEIAQGDLALHTQNWSIAQAYWARAASRPVSEATLRALAVRQSLAKSVQGREFARQFLIFGASPRDPWTALAQAHREMPTQGAITYLWFRAIAAHAPQDWPADSALATDWLAGNDGLAPAITQEIKHLTDILAARRGQCPAPATTAEVAPYWYAEAQARCLFKALSDSAP